MNCLKKLFVVGFALAATLTTAVFSNAQQRPAPLKTPVDYVNTRIGNISHLLVPTFPTTHLPHSMLRMIPGHESYVTFRMRGLPLNVPSHRQGDVLLLKPFSGEPERLTTKLDFTYDHEVSKPHFYSVTLDEHDIDLQFAPGEKAAMFTLQYNGNPGGFVLQTNDAGEISIQGKAISGYENYNGVKHYFYLETEQTPVKSGYLTKEGNAAFFVAFTDKKVRIRYGVSYISTQQAANNLRKEINHFNLAALSEKAKQVWNKELGKIQITGGTEDEKTTFYTALYRSSERMISISEDGKYFSAFDKAVHSDNGTPYWTDDWVWDTHLALHPLQTLLNPVQQEQKLVSFLRAYEQSGWVPTFPTVFGDAHCMNGNHAAITALDAYNKGLTVDVNKWSQALHKTVSTETMIPWVRSGSTSLDSFYQQHGWFPALHPGEKETVKEAAGFEQRQSVAVTLAAAYDDWAIGKLATAAGNNNLANTYDKRSYNYRNLFNAKTGFFHPKDASGNFIEPFDYIFSGGIGARAYYDENNAWTYIWDVKHDIPDLINLFGGKEPFVKKLDQLFVEDLKKSRWQYYAVLPDATGNVGQFVMGNEPSFHIPYLYNYAGQPWKTQKMIRFLMDSWFRNDLMGICGDEDGGGMSAFYVFSAMGFYPCTPGIPVYTIGSPLFKQSVLQLANGKKFTVLAPNASASNKYIVSAKLNGKPWNKTWFTHTDLMQGGILELVLSNKPNKQWGTEEGAAPPSGR